MLVFLALLAGLVSACAFEPIGVWPLMPLAFAVLLELLARARSLRMALGLGWVFGLGQFVLGLNWIATAFTYQAAMPAWLGWVAVVLLSVYLAAYPAMAAGLAWRYGQGRPLRLVLLLAAAWIVTEWLRGTMFTGFAWNPVGVAALSAAGADVPAFASLARYIGTYGLSGAIVLFGGLWALAVRRLWPMIDRGLTRPHADIGFRYIPRKLVGALLLVAVPVLAFVLSPPGETPPAHTDRSVHIVQPNIGQQDKHDPGFRGETWARLTRLTGPPSGGRRLILWPEAAVPEYLGENADARLRTALLMGPGDALMTGGVAIERDRDGAPVAGRNSLFVLLPGGQLAGRYDKAHLVPYGEYLPARPVLSAIGLSRLVPGNLDFWPGPGPRTLDVPGWGRVGVQICYEVIFSGHVIEDGRRPDVLFNPSNDAWFGRWGPPQHLAQARLRALEEGVPALRATPTGISAVIDARGRLLDALPWREAGTITAAMPRPLPPTPFARLGNVLPFLFAGLLVLIAFAPSRFARGEGRR